MFKPCNTIHSRSAQAGFFCFCWLIIGPMGWAQESSQSNWQTGNTGWTGSGYQTPSEPSSPNGSAPQKSSLGSSSYTVPIDPNSPSSGTKDTAPFATTDFYLGDPNFGVTLVAGDQAPADPILPSLDPTIDSPAGEELPVGDITAAIESEVVPIEEPPLEEEVVRWYHYPRRWIQGWNSHAEIGLDGSDGNADTIAFQAGFETKRKLKYSTWAVDIDYRQASSRGVTTEGNGRFNVDYDRLVGESSWSAFSKLGLEWDRFKAFDLRVNMNGGLGYHWIRNDRSSLVSRFGAGASREIGAPIDDWIPEAVFGLEAEHQLTARQKMKGKIDYFPAWEDFGDYRLVTDVAWEILLDGSDNFSLKLSATDRYDSTPQGAKPNDIYYSLLLLYKF